MSSEQQSTEQQQPQQVQDQQQQQEYPKLGESQNQQVEQQEQQQQQQNQEQIQVNQDENTQQSAEKQHQSPVKYTEETNYTKEGPNNQVQQQEVETQADVSQLSPQKQLQLENEFQNLKTQEIYEKNQQQQQFKTPQKQQPAEGDNVEDSNDVEVVDKKQEEHKKEKSNKIFDNKNLNSQQQQNLMKEQEKIISEINQQQQYQQKQSTPSKIINTILPFFTQQIVYEKQQPGHYYQQYKSSDIQVLFEANSERKKQQYEILKLWDQERATFLNFHRNLIELVQGTVDMRCKASNDVFNSIVKYFQSKFNLELSYMEAYQKWNQQKVQHQPQYKFPEDQSQQKEQPPQQHSPQIFSQELIKYVGEDNINYKVIKIVNECEKQNQIQLEKVKKFATVLQAEIIESKLKEHYFEYTDNVNEIQASLINLQKQTTKANIAAQEASNDYASLFSQQLNFQHKINKDLHKKLEVFLKNAQEQVNFSKLLAKETLVFWEKVVDLEKKRLQVYNSVLETYVKAYTDIYGESQHKQEILKEMGELKEFVEQQKFDQCLDLQYILGPDYVKDIYFHLGKKEEEITPESFKYANVFRFFTAFTFQNVDCRLLILKELKAKRNTAQHQGNPATREFKECKMYVTVDGYLLIYDLPQEREHGKPVLTIPLTKEQFKFIDGGDFSNVVEVIRHRKGLILSTKEKYELQFDNLDILEELIEYVDRMEVYFNEHD